MELLSRLHEAVTEVYSKKYSVRVGNEHLYFCFESLPSSPVGDVSVFLQGSEIARGNVEFDVAESLVSNDIFKADIFSFNRDEDEGVVIAGVNALKLHINPAEVSLNAPDDVALDPTEREYQALIRHFMSSHEPNGSVLLHPNTVFKKDIFCDELVFIEFIMSIESHFEIEIDDDELEGEVSYKELLKKIKS